MKVACVLIEHLPVKAELHRDPALAGRQVILAGTSGARREVYDFASGLKNLSVGMPLERALSCCCDAVVLEADVSFYEAVFEEVLDSLQQRSPVVESGGMGCACVGLDGLEEMYGGEARLIGTLVQAAHSYLEPKIGVAEGKFVARIAAHIAPPGRAVKAPDDVRAFLRARPVEMLPLAGEMTRRLRSFGLETLGQVGALTVGAMQAQFGPAGRLAWELSNGIDRSFLVPRQVEETVSESLTFPSPTASIGTIHLGVETLLGRAFAQPLLRGRYARLATLTGSMSGGTGWTQRVPFREPAGDKDRALFAIKAKLECHPVPGPLEDMQLTMSGLTGDAGRQSSLFVDVRRRESLREAMRQMEASMGRRPPIYQVREMEPWSRIPERRMALVEYAP